MSCWRATWLSCAALALGIAWPTPAAAEAGGSRPFIRVEGTRFFAGDAPFYFVGGNLNVMHGPEARKHAALTIAAAASDGLRVGRVWALGEGLAQEPGWKRRDYLFRAGPEGWQEAAFVQLDRVIAAAGKQGLRLIVTLSNRWADYGGIPMYLRWAKEEDTEAYGYSDRFFANEKARKWYVAHLQRVVGRVNTVSGVPYRDDPTIMAWELQNEMSGTPEAAATRRAWVVRMARTIREIDHNHLIVPGLIGYDLVIERKNWIAMCRLPEVGFCDQHIYPEEHLRSRGRNLQAYIDDRVQLAHHVVGKPIVFGEFGFADRGSQARRASWHARFLARLFYDGGNGGLVWIYQPTLPWRRKFGVLVDKRHHGPVRRALAHRARVIARRVPQPRNPRLGPEVGERPVAPTHAMVVGRRAPHSRWRRTAGKTGASWTLKLPVDRFYRAWFEEAGSWDGGVLVHTYGRRTGWVDYRFVGPGRRIGRLRLRARLSSEYPSAAAPPDGFSRVRVLLDGREVGKLRVQPDDGIGAWYAVEIAAPALLARLRTGVHRLRFEVDAGPEANGVAIYGRETRLNREPIEEPGPITLTVGAP